MEHEDKIYVAGNQTLIGAAILSTLKRLGFPNVISEVDNKPDLENRNEVEHFFETQSPDYVFLAAGKSGGIGANQKYPAELMLNNLLVECHIIHSAYKYKTKKLLYLASSCIYPRLSHQPMQISSIMTGPLEPTNEAYGIAKISGIKLCEAYRKQYGVKFITSIPTNVFGPGDDFSPDNSHVIAALMQRMHYAKLIGQPWVNIWGSGRPRREFIFTDDLGDACIFVMNQYDDAEVLNLGSGIDLSIAELAEYIRAVTCYSGELQFDSSKSDGMPLKTLDSTQLRKMGWMPSTDFKTALEKTYAWFLNSLKESP
jgi:GDP-L-fucose synthase